MGATGVDPDAFPGPAPMGPYNTPAPTGAATFGSVFDGTNPNGTWSLYVFDDAAMDSGTIAGGWELDITLVTNEEIVNGTGADDTLIITATSSDTGSYTLNGGAPVPFAGVTRFEFNGLGGNDLMQINNPMGGLFAPVNGIAYNGGGHPGDRLENLGGTADSGSYSVGATPDVGTVVHSGAGTNASRQRDQLHTGRGRRQRPGDHRQLRIDRVLQQNLCGDECPGRQRSDQPE
jgi:hypothetical protein